MLFLLIISLKGLQSWPQSLSTDSSQVYESPGFVRLFIIQKNWINNYKLHCDNDIDIGEELFTRP